MCWKIIDFFLLLVFNVTFNNILVIMWRSVLLVEETGVPEENHRPAEHFFLFNYVPHLFLLTCVKFHGKKINNNDTLIYICLLPFFQMASNYVTLGRSKVNKPQPNCIVTTLL
jgi:hypothetical protein